MGKTKGDFYAKAAKYQFPSLYGSHASMLDEDNTKTLNKNSVSCPRCLTLQDAFPLQIKRESVAQFDGTTKEALSVHMNRVDCKCGCQFTPNLPVFVKDEDGTYLTESNNLDSGMADPYRCAGHEMRKALIKAVQQLSVRPIDLANICKGIQENLHKPRPQPMKGDLAECAVFTGNE